MPNAYVYELYYCYEYENAYIYELVMINHMWYRNAYDENVKLDICEKHANESVMKL